MSSWIVVANKSVTSIYNADKNRDELDLVKTFENDKARLKERDLDSDGPGTTFNSITGKGGRQFSRSKSAHEHILELYANQIASYVKKADSNNQFNSLILTAGPEMMGLLLKEFQKKKIEVTKKIGKEYSNLNIQNLSQVLRSDVIETFPVSP